ncbi:MAG: hypothetical protein AAGF73_09640 [Actinomycetota bacterium]
MTETKDATRAADDAATRGADILTGELSGQELADGIYVLPGQGNSLAIETDAGVVVVDASGAPRTTHDC